jgi:cytochrome b561
MVELLISTGIIILSVTIFRLISRLIKINKLQEETYVPIDTFVSRGIELLNSIPRLLLILLLQQLLKEVFGL